MTTSENNIKTPFNEEFCTLLEHRICHELEKSTNSELKGFWCDGVSWFPSEKQLTKKNLNLEFTEQSEKIGINGYRI